MEPCGCTCECECFVSVSKRSQWVKLWIYSRYSKCFWKRYNAAWLFWGEPSSDHAVPTAAMYSIRELNCQGIWSLQYLAETVIFVNTEITKKHQHIHVQLTSWHSQLSVYWSVRTECTLAVLHFWVRCFRKSLKPTVNITDLGLSSG
jgi:hypothetical protein